MTRITLSRTRLQPDPETELFWQAIDEEKFLITHCDDCHNATYYPRSVCPHCGSVNTRFEEISGAGQIYTFSIMRKVEQPYAIAYVQLQEGPCVLTNIVGCNFADISIGLTVQLEFAQTNTPGELLPVFAPADRSLRQDVVA